MRFNLVAKVERLHVRLLSGPQWKETNGDGDCIERSGPDEWVACHEPKNWAVTLSDNSNKKMAALKEWDKQFSGSNYPFNDEESFELWFSDGRDPAVVIWEELESPPPKLTKIAEIADVDELGNVVLDLDERYPEAKEWDSRRQDFEHELRPPDHSVNYIYDPEE